MDVGSIQVHALHKLKKIFQKDPNSLIEWYLADSEKKLQALYLAIEKNSVKEKLSLLKELRNMSTDIGAIPFSYLCLSIEMAISEYRLINLVRAWHVLKTSHEQLKENLLQLHQDLTPPERPINNLAQIANGP